MAFTYDPTTNRGRVRLLAVDTEEATAYLTDAEVDAFLALTAASDGTENVFLAGAEALDAKASKLAMMQGKVKLLDLQTDGPAVAKVLQDKARDLRARDAAAPAFDIAEQADDVFQMAELLWKNALREGA